MTKRLLKLYNRYLKKMLFRSQLIKHLKKKTMNVSNILFHSVTSGSEIIIELEYVFLCTY